MSVLAIDEQAYHADAVGPEPSLSSSLAHVLCTRSPAHAKALHPRLSPQPVTYESDSMDLGTVCHALLLGGLDAVQVIDADNYRTKAAQQARDEARAAGLTPILAAKWLDAQAMIDRVREQLDELKVDPPMFSDGQAEVVLSWEEQGVHCRARLDWLRTDLLAVDDLKTSSSGPEAWQRRSLYDYGYDVRAAFYLRGIRAVFDAQPTFRWLVSEKEPPYACFVVTPGADVLALGNDKVDYALRVWKRCLDDGAWPSYPPVASVAELSAFEEARWLQKRDAA